jgi:endonuclease/exonuclease/phosphatase (EEP) superfamily protein YafD
VRRRDVALAAACVVLLAPAVLLSLLRLTEPPWDRAVQAVAFTPFGLPLYAAALLLLGGVMLVRRTVALPYAGTAGLALAGLVVHAWWFAPQVTGDLPAAAPDAERVVVMTSNVLKGHADVVGLLDQVRDHDVDVLVVGEITESSLAEMEEAGLESLLPFRAGRPGQDDTVFGTMVFSNQPTEPVASLDTAMGSLVVDIEGLRVLAVHPSTPLSAERWRADHATILAAVEAGVPDLVVGDFNAAPDHAPMRALEDAGYRDSFELTNAGFQPTWPVDGLFGPVGLLGPVAQIDHVLVGEDWTVTGTERTDLGGSDHRPVLATVASR